MVVQEWIQGGHEVGWLHSPSVLWGMLSELAGLSVHFLLEPCMCFEAVARAPAFTQLQSPGGEHWGHCSIYLLVLLLNSAGRRREGRTGGTEKEWWWALESMACVDELVSSELTEWVELWQELHLHAIEFRKLTVFVPPTHLGCCCSSHTVILDSFMITPQWFMNKTNLRCLIQQQHTFIAKSFILISPYHSDGEMGTESN